ncbi:putative integral membrane protein [Pseudomonas syringae pv. pisi]|nr:putative integral membrane protein [Pseudomonas syringae pv. pisi]
MPGCTWADRYRASGSRHLARSEGLRAKRRAGCAGIHHQWCIDDCLADRAGQAVRGPALRHTGGDFLGRGRSRTPFQLSVRLGQSCRLDVLRRVTGADVQAGRTRSDHKARLCRHAHDPGSATAGLAGGTTGRRCRTHRQWHRTPINKPLRAGLVGMDHVGDSLDPAAIVQKAQPVTGSLLLSGWRYRAVILSIVFSAMGYMGFSLWGGWQAVSAATGKVGLLGIGVALLMSAINYALRFVRWQLYLSVLGHPLAWRKSLRIYLAGFALTTTPGKAGEALRGVLLRPLGVPYPQSFAAFVSERLSDLLAIVLLTLFGLSWYPQAQPMILLGLALVLTGSLVLSRRHLLERLQVSLSTKNTRVSSLWQQLFNVLLAARQCLHGNVLLTASLLSLLAWSAEALAFYWMLGWMGAQIPLTFAVFTYALAMLAGALSFMPGGLGSAEAVMVGLLMFKGMPGADAIAATLLIRLATLWFAVAIGAVMLSRFTGAVPAPTPQP